MCWLITCKYSGFRIKSDNLYVFTILTALFERPAFHVRIHVNLQSYLLSFIEDIPLCFIIYKVNKLCIVAVKHSNSIFSF